jgi:hypothetical protein
MLRATYGMHDQMCHAHAPNMQSMQHIMHRRMRQIIQ